MELIIKDYPREYLALKINYIKQQIGSLPDIRLRMIEEQGVKIPLVIVGRHRYKSNSEQGKRYLQILNQKDYLTRQLSIYEAIWNNIYIGDPARVGKPCNLARRIYTDTDRSVILNKAYFDSLRNDSDTRYDKPSNYIFDGIKYRSASERDIAIFYTEMGIPFKYEPEVYIKGLAEPIHPDFVLYIPELDNCKFHEHFGMKQSSAYLRTTTVKYRNYTDAGLLPETDILFTHDVDSVPFDIRTLSLKLNIAIYTSMLTVDRIHKNAF